MKRCTELVNFDPCPDDPYRPNSTPIYQTATFDLESALGGGKYDYTRSGNPTRSVVEAQIAKLEGCQYGFAFSSGMAALNALSGLLKPGDHILAGDDLYGGTYRLITKRLQTNRGITANLIDMTDLEQVREAIKANTRLIILETPSNPLQKIANLKEITKLAHQAGVLVAVDNSFMSPWLQQPFNFGVDIVMHSATKYLAGHSDVSGGFLLTNCDELAKQIKFIQNSEGAALSPFDSWLILRGVQTLGLRVERQELNAKALLAYLVKHPLVTKVYYPTLATHPGSKLHQEQASGGGGVICFETDSMALSQAIVNNTQLFHTSVSFGSVHSSISLPANMSHGSIPASERTISDDLVRIAVGIEDSEDLISDLDQAIKFLPN